MAIKDIWNEAFEAGEILEANHMNEIINRVKTLYDQVNTAPTLSYVADMPEGQTKYYRKGEDTFLIFNFTSSAAGSVTITVERNGIPMEPFIVSRGRIVIPLGPMEDGRYKYTVSARDGLNRPSESPAYLEFVHVIGGITVSTNLINRLSEIPLLTTRQTPFTFNYSYSYPDATSGDAQRGIKYQILNHSDTIYTQTLTENVIDAQLELTMPTLAGNYTFKLWGYLDNGIKIIESSQVLVPFSVVQPNTAYGSILEQNTTKSDELSSFKIQVNSGYSLDVILSAKCEVSNDTTTYSFNENNLTHGDVFYSNFGKLPAGDYTATIWIYPTNTFDDLDNDYPNNTTTFSIAQGYQPGISYEDNGLLAYFEANGRTNQNTIDAVQWSTSHNMNANYHFDLANFNYQTNGWQEIATLSTSLTCLTLNGIAQAVLKDGENQPYNFLQLLKQEGNEGFSFEIMCRGRNVGNTLSRICSIQSPDAESSLGFNIKYNEVTFTDGSSTISSPLVENEFSHIVFVIDKQERLTGSTIEATYENYNPPFATMRIYINGVLMRAAQFKMPATIPNYPIVLNAAPKNMIETYPNTNSSCDIKLIRLYNRPLLSSQVYNNFVNSQSFNAEIYNTISKRNDVSTTSLPVIYFVKNKSNLSNNDSNNIKFSALNQIKDKNDSKTKYVNCAIFYSYYPPGATQPAWVKYPDVDIYLQGTSSLQYPVKNYKIKNYNVTPVAELPEEGESKRIYYKNTGESPGFFIWDSNNYVELVNAVDISEQRKKVKIIPPHLNDTSWVADSTYTLKCDYMEQSHRNNTPTAKFYDLVLDTIIGADSNKYSPARRAEPPAGPGKAKYRDAIDGFACLVYYNDNLDPDVDLTAGTSYGGNSNDFYAGSFMFNIDKSGAGLGFEPDGYDCISYEGGSNINISAATFYPYEYYRDHGIEEPDVELATKDEYYLRTMEPRFNYYEEVGGDDYDVEKDQERVFAPLERNINWLKQFTPIYGETEPEIPEGSTKEEAIKALKEKFADEFSTYFSYEYCLAYYLQMMTFTQVDNVGKNAMFDCWRVSLNDSDPEPPGGGWGPLYPRPYDMDTQMGENNSGQDVISPAAEFSPLLSPTLGGTAEGREADLKHSRYAEYNVKQSRLWTPFAIVYQTEIRDAYNKLRSENIYDVSTIATFVDELTSDIIGERFYNRDAGAKYLSQLAYSDDGKTLLGFNSFAMPCLQGNRKNRYMQFLTKRLNFLDSYFNLKKSSVILRSNAAANAPNGSVNIDMGIAVYDPVYVTFNIDQAEKDQQITFIDAQSSYNNGKEGQLFKVLVEGNDKNLYFYSAPSIKRFTDIQDLKLTSFNGSAASNLHSLNLSDNDELTEIYVQANPYITDLNVSGCDSLKTLDLNSDLTNLVSLDISYLPMFTNDINISGSNIQSLKATNSKMKSLTLVNNLNLTDLDITNCSGLTEITLNNCDKITEFSSSGVPNLEKLNISNCNGLTSITLTNIVNLKELVLTNNPNLTSVTITNCTGVGLNTLNLALCPQLTSLILTGSFGQEDEDGNNTAQHICIKLPHLDSEWQGLTTLEIGNSGVTTIVYGNDASDNGICDLTGLKTKPLTTTNAVFAGNKKVKIITNLDYIGNLSQLFLDCNALERIIGRLEATTSSMFGICKNCYALSDITQLTVVEQSGISITSIESGFQCPNANNSGSLTPTSGVQALIQSLPNLSNFGSCFYYNFRRKSGDTSTTLNLSKFFQLKDGATRNTNITGSNMFYNSTMITTIPNDFLTGLNTNNTIGITFYGCSNLSSIDESWAANHQLTSLSNLFRDTKLSLQSALASLNKSTKSYALNTATYTFYNCYNNSSNPDSTTELQSFFANFGPFTSLDHTFYGCKGVSAIPSGLLARHTGLTACRGTFQNLNSSTGQVTLGNIFSNANTTNYNRLTDITDMFRSTKIGNIPSDLFLYTPALTTLSNAFRSAKLTSVPSNLVSSLANLTTASCLFYDNPDLQFRDVNSITTYNIPIDFFSTCTSLEDVSYLFYNCKYIGFDITKINEIINFLPISIEQATGIFQSCVGLTGSVQDYLFKNKINLQNVDSALRNTKISGPITSNIFYGCNALASAKYAFAACTELGWTASGYEPYIFPNNLFDSCRNTLLNVDGMFANCYNINGVLQEDLSNLGLFENCFGLTTVARFFMNCHCLKGNIPSNMFKSSIIDPITNQNQVFSTLENISYMFSGCSALGVKFENMSATSNGIYKTSTENILVSENLLDNCPNIKEAQYLFNSMRLYPPRYLNDRSSYVHGIKDMYPDKYYNRNVNVDTTYNTTDITIPQGIFSKQKQLSDVSYAFNSIPHANISLSSKFMEQSQTSLTNLSRIFYNTTINTLGSDASIFLNQGLDTFITNADYAFGIASSQPIHANQIAAGGAPLPSKQLQNASRIGMFQGQNNAQFKATLKALNTSANIYVDNTGAYISNYDSAPTLNYADAGEYPDTLP